MKIINEENVDLIFTAEDDVKSLLNELQLNVSDVSGSCNAVVSNCEALIAFNGGIMIDEVQTAGNKLKDLPTVHVVIGRTGQIVENLHAGMARINNKYRDKRPGSITTLRGAKEDAVQMAAIDYNANRILYLLLLEDGSK